MTFTPTEHNGKIGPCNICGRHATGIGLGQPSKGDPRWICELCVPYIEHLKSVMKFDIYEHQAVTDAADAVGPLVAEYGADLSQWEPEQIEKFVREIWLQCGASIRRQVVDGVVPF